MNKATNFAEQARAFKEKTNELGFNVVVSNAIVRVTKRFTPGDMQAFVACDMDGPYLLSLVPTTSPGSVWGTDGGGVGGYSAVQNGCYQLSISGVSKRFLKELQK